MATDTQNLLQENPSKTLGANPFADNNASLKNSFQWDAPNTTTPLSFIDNPVSNVPAKEPNEWKVGGSVDAVTPVASSPMNTAIVLDIQKKNHQARQFGIPMQLSEQKKEKPIPKPKGLALGPWHLDQMDQRDFLTLVHPYSWLPSYKIHKILVEISKWATMYALSISMCIKKGSTSGLPKQ